MQDLTTVDRFRATTPDTFEQELDRVWTGITEIKQTVVEQVQEQNIPPMSGLGILACVTAQAFGYSQFHGSPSPVDLAGALTGSAAASS